MLRLAVFLALLTSGLFGQSLATVLSFETDHPGGTLPGWQGTGTADDKVVHGGKWSARLETNEQGSFSMLGHTLPMEFAGRSIVLRGFLKTENVGGFAALWMREDGDAPNLAFDNMRNRAPKGTTEWTQYTIALPRVAEAKQLVFGALLSGSGKAWIDDLELLVDGKPVWEAPKQEIPKTVLDTDREFDQGSGVKLDSLNQNQIRNLATLGKVWGFLKYHHRRVAAGELHWDYELMRALPPVLAAADRNAANVAIAKWVARLGPIGTCDPCPKLDESKIHLRPDNGWIEDESALGAELSSALRSIYHNRSTGPQFYVSLAPMVGNPVFRHELAYTKIALPDSGLQLLGLFRFWNIVRYWFPYRDALGEDWDAVLTEFIPRLALAKDAAAYDRELMALTARAHDTHAGLSSTRASQPPQGRCAVPAEIRFVRDQAVVARTFDPKPVLQRGDVITAIDGVAVSQVVKDLAPYYAASNEAARLNYIARAITRGGCDTVAKLGALRDGASVQIDVQRSSTGVQTTHDRPGEAFQRLSDDVAYLKLSSVRIAEIPKYLEGAKDTKGLIIDIRNYPSEFVVFALGSRLADKSTPFARFTTGDLANPGAFHWGAPLSLFSSAPGYRGKAIVLVDETTISSAEYTAMALRAAGATVIGSTTQGADGNVSAFSFPGGASSRISGIGVFYPDKRPTQRVGIVPDIRVEPTVEGLKAGRDEVLERAILEIVGKLNNPV